MHTTYADLFSSADASQDTPRTSLLISPIKCCLAPAFVAVQYTKAEFRAACNSGKYPATVRQARHGQHDAG